MPNGGFHPPSPRAPLFGLPGSRSRPPERYEVSDYRDLVLATPGLAAYFRLGEKTYSVAVDYRNRWHGAWSGSPQSVPALVRTEPDCATLFDGSSAWVSVPKVEASTPLFVGDVFSAEFWVQTTTTAHDQSIVDNGGGSFAIQILASGLVRADRSDTTIMATSTVAVNDGKTHHVVVTKNGATLKIWVDAVDVTGAVTNDTLTNHAERLFAIGRYWNAAANFLEGTLDEVAIYNTQLSSATVAEHYAVGAIPTPVDGPQLDLIWDVAAAVDGPALDLVWDTRAAVDGGQLDLLWDLRTPVDGGQLDLLWDVRSQVNGGALDLIWDLSAAVTGAALDLVWDTRAAVAGAALDLLWDLRAAVDGPALDLIWDLLVEGVQPPPPTETGAAGGPMFQARWSEVDGPPLTLRWGSVSSPQPGEGALSESARPILEPVERKLVRLRRRERPRVVEPEPVSVDAAPLELRWALRGAVEARVALKWAATEDAMLVGRLQARVAASTAEVARLAREVDRAREEAEAAAGARIEALKGEVARLRDEAESLELLLLSD